MPSEVPYSATDILGPNAQRASVYPGAQHVPLEYPGRRPSTSFLYLGGLIAPVRDSPSRSALLINTGLGEIPIDEFLAAHDLVPLNQRYAILAVGSNACPGRLEEKFADKDHDAIIALKGWIANVDSIYAAWLADYGALPATIAEAPGTEVEIWLTLLTPAQLSIMNASEGLGDDYSLVSVASPFRVGLTRIENIYAYFDPRALVWEGEHVRIEDFPSQNSRLRSLTEKQILAAVLDQLEFACGQSIEQRHRAMTTAPVVVENLNSLLAQSFMGTNAHGHTLFPVPVGELQQMRLSRCPMPGDIENIPFRAYRTINRDDDEGEFIIRLSPRAKRLLRGAKYVAVYSTTNWLPTNDPNWRFPKVIAAVRSLSQAKEDSGLIGCDDIGFCQLDMVLRVSIGARGYDPKTNWSLSDVTGKAEYVHVAPLPRSIRPLAAWPRWIRRPASSLGYQWLPFRVHRALDGDFETPICRIRQHYLSSLGIQDGGVVVMESVAGRATRRLLPADEKQTEAALDFEEFHATDLEWTFEKQLGVDRGLRMPGIYMDYSARKLLEVVPGQVVWVRRELWSVFRRESLKNVSALTLAFLGIAFSLRELYEKYCPGMGDWFLLEIVALGVAILSWVTYHECRNSVRAD